MVWISDEFSPGKNSPISAAGMTLGLQHPRMLLARPFCIPHGSQVRVPTYPAPLPVGKPRQELFLCRLCADSSTEAPLNTFPFQLSPAPSFQADQCWIFADVCDGTNALLRAYCSHVASAPSPSCQPLIVHAQTTKPPEKPNSVQDSSKNLSLEPAGLVVQSPSL